MTIGENWKRVKIWCGAQLALYSVQYTVHVRFRKCRQCEKRKRKKERLTMEGKDRYQEEKEDRKWRKRKRVTGERRTDRMKKEIQRIRRHKIKREKRQR
jgi:hypothetical protein